MIDNDSFLCDLSGFFAPIDVFARCLAGMTKNGSISARAESPKVGVVEYFSQRWGSTFNCQHIAPGVYMMSADSEVFRKLPQTHVPANAVLLAPLDPGARAGR